MLFVSTFGPGMSLAMPDVCKTPPFAVPVPMPNIATNALVVPGYFTVMINCMPELNLASSGTISSGDEAGAMGGIVSSTIIGPARAVMGSMRCMVGGTPVRRMTDPTIQNTANAVGIGIVPSQPVKLVIS